MKKVLVFGLYAVTMVFLVACGAPTRASSASSASNEPGSTSVGESTSSTPSPSEQSSTPVNIEDLSSGDEVSIVGQAASTGLVNGNTVWVQVSQPDGTFVIYHCQLKDEFIGEGEEVKLLDVVKIKGSFLSLLDSEQENTSPLVTLYDCEIV